MSRFFMAGSNISGGVAVFRGSDLNHLRVLRLRLGESLVICDGEGTDYRCTLKKITAGEAEAEVVGSAPSPGEPSVGCKIFAALPKGDRAEYIVQKCTEAGAQSITLFKSGRCVSTPDGKSLERRLERLRRIAQEAAKQSGRGMIPGVSYLPGFTEALDAAIKTELVLFMYEEGERVPIKEMLERAGDFKTLSIITGPEGGFERHEAAIAAAVGVSPCSMGPRIFRCETAPLVALTAALYHSGNL